MNSVKEELLASFPSLHNRELSEDYIKEHSYLLWDIPEVPLIRAVPLYMLWCLENSSDEGELVFDDTIRALNTYARENPPNDIFKSTCDKKQVKTILSFLNWCKKDLTLDYEPSLDRAINNWAIVLTQK